MAPGNLTGLIRPTTAIQRLKLEVEKMKAMNPSASGTPTRRGMPPLSPFNPLAELEERGRSRPISRSVVHALSLRCSLCPTRPLARRPRGPADSLVACLLRGLSSLLLALCRAAEAGAARWGWSGTRSGQRPRSSSAP